MKTISSGLFRWVMRFGVPIFYLAFIRLFFIITYNTGLGWANLRGVVSDFFIAGLFFFAVLISPIKNKSIAMAIIFVLLAFGQLGNFQHVDALHSAVSVSYLHYLLDLDFLKGTISISTFSWCLLLVAIFISYIIYDSSAEHLLKKWNIIFITVAFSGALLIVWPINPSVDRWKQRNVFSDNFMDIFLSSIPDNIIDPNTLKRANSEWEMLKLRDISGQSRFVTNKKNVLLVMMEGISGHTLKDLGDNYLHMPNLIKIAQDNVYYDQFIAIQNQTNRTQYALFCGDYPNLVATIAKVDLVETIKNKTKLVCLPEVLKEEGYETAYLQGDPIGFMGVKKFMSIAGFDSVLDTKWFKKPYFKHSWGIADYDFYDQSFRKIQELNATGKPWFLSLKSIGTHHNYAVPETFKTSKFGDYGHAVQYLDHAIGDFMEKLKQSGILKNTLVILTSDESHGDKNDETGLWANWIPLIVIDEGVQSRVISDLYFQADVPLSILDYLEIDIADIQPLIGRSLFRKYNTNRNMLFSATYKKTVYWYQANGNLVKCDFNFSSCYSARVEKDFIQEPQKIRFSRADTEQVKVFRTITDLNDWDHRRFELKEDDKVANGWLATYYTALDFEGRTVQRRIAKVDFDWGMEGPIVGFPVERFSAVFETCVDLDQDTTIQVYIDSDDGSRLEVDDKIVFDRWLPEQIHLRNKSIPIKKGVHLLRVEYWEFYGYATIQVVLKDKDGKLLELKTPKVKHDRAMCH